jgi:CRP/FNR family transcriptional regulator, anaerobic regulatory protein
MPATHPLKTVVNPPSRACLNCPIHTDCLSSCLESGRLNKFEGIRESVPILRRGEYLFHTNDSLNALYIVRSGILKTSVTTEDGSEQITGFYLPGDILGLDGIETGYHRCTAVVMQTSSVCALPFQQLTSLCSEFRELQSQIWRLMSQEVMARQDLQLVMGQRDAEARLSTFLLTLSARMRRLGYSATHFQLPMTRHEIGNYLGLSMETVSRIFTRLQNDGVISRYKRFIQLMNMDQLRMRCIHESKPAELKRIMH